MREWRGAHWSVSVSDELGDPTLAEQDSSREQAERAAAAEDPVVQAALATFEGARIERVTAREIGEPELAGEAAPFTDPSDDEFDGEDIEL